MAENLQAYPIPLFGRGEQTAAAPDASSAGEVARMENLLIAGPGVLTQAPDWLVVNTLKDNIATPPVGGTESDAVCGIFEFTQPVGASPGAGVLFSFDNSGNQILLDHVDENAVSLRRKVAYAGYTLGTPPQITGFEWFGKFIFCEYAREAASVRLGLAVYDPVADTITIPSLELIAAGAAAAPLRFRGISRHQGGLPIGWGYQDEETGNVDRPEILRYGKYTAADLTALASWKEEAPPASETSPGKVVVGTPGRAIIGCAPSGQGSVIGKEGEVYFLSGDYGAQLNTRYIGQHGPVSTCGIASWGVGAAWMAAVGVCVSVGGDRLRILTTDRARKRLETYYDLTYCAAGHDSLRNRIGFLLRRQRTITGDAKTTNWGDEILWWDYERDEFYVEATPTTCFSIGTIKGYGQALAGPTGAPTSLAATNVAATSAQANWTNGDVSPDVTTFVEYKKTAAATWTVAPAVAAGVNAKMLTSLSSSIPYQYRMRHFKNGQYSAYSATQSFTTLAPSVVGQPTNFNWTQSGISVVAGKTYVTVRFTWTRGEFSAGSKTEVWFSTVNNFATATKYQEMQANVVSTTKTQLASPTLMYYYWVRHRLANGTVGVETLVNAPPVIFDIP